MVRGKPVSCEIRNFIIEAYKKGKNPYKISKDINIPRSTVRDIIKLNKISGNCEIKKRTGRKPIASKSDLRILNKIVKENRFKRTTNITLEWRKMIHKNISVDTCRRSMKKLGYKFYKAREKPYLSKKQKKDRLKFAKEHLNWTLRQWKTIIWSDESRFETCFEPGGYTVIRKNNEKFNSKCLKRKVKVPPSVMVWGCMSGRGTGRLCFINGKINSTKYQDILEHYLLPSIPSLESAEGEHIFQQDGASPHTSKSTMSWLASKNLIPIKWPANSPDLSPIESLWGKIKKRLYQNPVPSTDDLRNIITEVWGSVTPEECRELVNTMPHRMKDVIKNKGDVTKW